MALQSLHIANRNITMHCQVCGSKTNTTLENATFMDKNMISYSLVIVTERSQFSYSGEVCGVDCLEEAIRRNTQHFTEYKDKKS